MCARQETGTYKAANKDLWSMTLEFCETINPNLDNFEADGVSFGHVPTVSMR